MISARNVELFGYRVRFCFQMLMFNFFGAMGVARRIIIVENYNSEECICQSRFILTSNLETISCVMRFVNHCRDRDTNRLIPPKMQEMTPGWVHGLFHKVLAAN